jgi:hypothetical protein
MEYLLEKRLTESNGKEMQDEMGLKEYDYGSRFSFPERAGWSNVDPLAEQMS